MAQFHIYQKEALDVFLSVRKGETRLGERCIFLPGSHWAAQLSGSEARFVLLGLPEDIGVRANGGIGGTHTAWDSFLRSFLNTQETKALGGAQFALLAALEAADWMEACRDAGADKLRACTARIDSLVFPVIEKIVLAGKIPIVIGGGHNNAYPILKGASLALRQAINAVNIDAHTDYRNMEGRHSGNGFRYARQEGFLKKYAVLGYHEAYNNQEIMAEFSSDPGLKAISWEDIFIREKRTWKGALKECLSHAGQAAFGVELDTDCIEGSLSSAATPVGISPRRAMRSLYQCGLAPGAAYLHLPEAIATRADGIQDPFAGKLLSYLVQGFCKGVLERGKG